MNQLPDMLLIRYEIIKPAKGNVSFVYADRSFERSPPREEEPSLTLRNLDFSFTVCTGH
jgi:hypothetical protein